MHDEEEKHTEAEARISAFLGALRASVAEADRHSAPPPSGFREVAAALDALLAKDSDAGPIRRFFALVNERPGLPGHENADKMKTLRRFRELRAQGVASEDAASKLGVELRTISRWKNEPVGYAEQVDAQLSDCPVSQRVQTGQDKTQG